MSSSGGRPIGGKALNFLHHKAYHPGSKRNKEKMFLHDQKKTDEQKKIDERAAEILEERKLQELRDASACATGQSSSVKNISSSSASTASTENINSGEKKKFSKKKNLSEQQLAQKATAERLKKLREEQKKLKTVRK